MTDNLLTVRDGARRLACSEAYIRKLVFARKVPFVKLGRAVRIRASDLEALIRAGLTLPEGKSR
jgi:excisionase family DNA binding protein